jgi:hypothetical protein
MFTLLAYSRVGEVIDPARFPGDTFSAGRCDELLTGAEVILLAVFVPGVPPDVSGEKTSFC